MGFPTVRMRRLRGSEKLRDMVAETKVLKNDLILPLFVIHGSGVKNSIPSMPGHFQLSVDNLLKEVEECLSLGISSFILFGIPESKDPVGSSGWRDDGIVQGAVSELKRRFPEAFIITDVCLCEYTDHGHCGIVKDGRILNDETLKYLSRMAVSHAGAGADMVAPSDMMDGRVRAIRDALDEEGFSHVPIMAYSAKYASSFYGPFREAAESAPRFGDRRSYQMDPRNLREALREVALDIEEGADIVMVKPALPYLDVIREVRRSFNVPVAAYNVSGEYAMVKAASKMGWIDGDAVSMEMLTSIKRAGADLIITYFAKEVARRIP